MNNALQTVAGQCHCGDVQFELDLQNGEQDLRRCNCSLCRRKGAIMLGVPIGRFRILRGAEHLRLYQWNFKIARHYFCSRCGIYTHHQRRSNPLEIGVNTGCLEGVDLQLFASENVGDGAAMTVAE